MLFLFLSDGICYFHTVNIHCISSSDSFCASPAVLSLLETTSTFAFLRCRTESVHEVRSALYYVVVVQVCAASPIQ